MKPYTPEYQQQLVEMHATTGWGGGGHKRAAAVDDLTRRYHCRTVLDYGCGKGTLKKALVVRHKWHPEAIDEYDPGVTGKDTPPEPAGLVACTDVLEHVEPHLVDEICADLRRVTLVVAYVLIVKQPSDKFLPDGRNAHLTLMSTAEWLGVLQKAGFRATHIISDDPKTLVLRLHP